MKFFVFASLLAVGAFASQCHPDYECCSGCEVVYTDAEGDWGVENRQWCFIGSNCGSNNAVSGYPICNGCQVVYTDADGQWGVENGDWCLIQNGKCGGSNPNPTQTTTFQNVIPVINLISSSGTSDFATQPVETHIAQQAYMGKEMPPAPYYEDCTITIEDADGTAVINGVKGKVKVRGNWTSNYPKKGLRINFEESQSVLGLNNGEKFKNWVLLAEYKDGSMLRNKSAFQVARGVLGGDGYFASDSTLVELKINGEYFGVYLLAEQQQINKGRVDITKGKDDYTGTDIGYLLEFDLGYTMYEDDIQKFTVDFNNNAPLKPYDGNGGSGKTIEPSGGFGFGGGMGFGGNTGMGNFGNWGGFGGQTGQPGQPGQTGGQTAQQPGQAGNTGMGNFGNWGGFGQNTNTNTNQGNQQQTGNNWGAQQGGNTNWGAQQGGNTNWGNFGGFGNRGGNNMKKRQFMMGGGDNITIKNDIYSTQQKEFISKFVNNAYNIMYEAAYNQNPLKFTSDYSSVVEAPELTPRQAIENVVEAESLADMFIVSEIACDADLYYSSFYLDVDFGPNGSKKLRFEAPWDFDSALGNKERCTDGKGHFAANITQDNGGMGGQKINPWLAVIMYEDWYQDMIRSRWSKAYDSGVFGKVVDMIHSDTQIAAEAFDRNYSKWDNINNNKQFANELSQGAKQCKTQSEAANFLAKWFEARVAFINSHWHK